MTSIVHEPRSEIERKESSRHPTWGGAVSEQVSVAEAKRRFSDLCNQVGYARETVVITRRGRPLVAMVSIAELERYWALEDEHCARLLERAIASSPGTDKVRSL